jgi:PBP1b-binding outer membrane lipoprotein LpoB
MKLTSILILSLLIAACTSIDPVRPVTDGYHQTLPNQKAPLMVWGNHPSAVNTATTWLLQRGYRVVEPSQLNKVFHEKNMMMTHTPEDQARLLQTGISLGAQQVIFIEATVSTQKVDDGNENGDGGPANRHALHNIVIAIRGIDSQSGDLQWSAKSYYPEGIHNPDEGVGHLTRSALAKAWR